MTEPQARAMARLAVRRMFLERNRAISLLSTGVLAAMAILAPSWPTVGFALLFLSAPFLVFVMTRRALVARVGTTQRARYGPDAVTIESATGRDVLAYQAVTGVIESDDVVLLVRDGALPIGLPAALVPPAERDQFPQSRGRARR